MSGIDSVAAILFILMLPVLLFVWVGFTVTHWGLGWLVLLAVIALLSAGTTSESQREQARATAQRAHREPRIAALREAGVSLLGTTIGLGLLLLIVLGLRAASQYW